MSNIKIEAIAIMSWPHPIQISSMNCTSKDQLITISISAHCVCMCVNKMFVVFFNIAFDMQRNLFLDIYFMLMLLVLKCIKPFMDKFFQQRVYFEQHNTSSDNVESWIITNDQTSKPSMPLNSTYTELYFHTRICQ